MTMPISLFNIHHGIHDDSDGGDDHDTMCAAPSDAVLALVQLPVVGVVGGSSVSPDAAVQGEAALQMAPLPCQALALFIVSQPGCCSSRLLNPTDRSCDGRKIGLDVM